MLIQNKNINTKEFADKVILGTTKALRKLVETSALNNESLVVGDKNGGFKSVPAKELLKEMNSETAV